MAVVVVVIVSGAAAAVSVVTSMVISTSRGKLVTLVYIAKELEQITSYFQIGHHVLLQQGKLRNHDNHHQNVFLVNSDHLI